MKNQPIIIIGAGRSGTNILRDCICSLDGFETWPCDEINYIWRHGNISKPTDRFTAADAHPSVQRFIKKEFDKLEQDFKADYVIEKTCANSLKVPFIDAIFPKAKYIFLVRNGYDVASSAKQRWTAPLELGYIFDKAKFVPVTDIPHYGFRYLGNRIKKLLSKEKRLAYWGPIYEGMMDDLKNQSLIEVCSRQWKECVETAYTDLNKMDKDRVHYLTYESFVNDPLHEMRRVMNYLGMDIPDPQLSKSVAKVSAGSIGNYKKYITGDALNKVARIIDPTMEKIYNKI